MLEHVGPTQSCHWYVYEVGVLVQDPVVAVSVPPVSVLPVMAGGAVFDGSVVLPLLTTPVRRLVAETLPPAFDAVTTTSIEKPTSDAWTVYELEVALAMFEQLVGDKQSCHW
jgi:hypothetical protein